MALAALSPSASAGLSPLLMAEEVERFSASEIRQAIAHWVGENRTDLAEALVVAGLSQYPDSEDILALGALVSEVEQDWSVAQERLECLMRVQADRVPAETLHHFIRVLRCRGAYFNAYLQSQAAIGCFPEHQGLRHLHAELTQLLESVSIEACELQAQVSDQEPVARQPS
jgi:hypothetical protein